MKLVPTITPRIIELLNFTPLQYMLRYVENAPANGMVYADDENEPSTCVVRIGHLLFFGGEITSECLSYVKTKILTFEIYEKYGVFYFFYTNESWRDALITLYPERCTLRERSLHSTIATAAETEIPSVIVPITAQLMESDVKNKEMIIDEVGCINRFMKDGFGYTLLVDGEIQGFCTSEYQSENELAIGIEVVQAHQKKGYAKAMTTAFLKEAVGKGYKVYWESWRDNTLSIQTALSCGFQHVADYPMIFLDLCDAHRSKRAPKECDVLAAVKNHLQNVETVKHVPKGASLSVYQVQTSSGIYYARFFTEGGLSRHSSFAAEVTAHKLMANAGVIVPRVVAFEHKEMRSGFSMMLAEEIPGVCMEEVWPDHNADDILREAGRQLALIHSIPVDGFGWIDRSSHDVLKGEKRSFIEYFDEFLADDLITLNYYNFTDDEQAKIHDYMEQARLILDVQQAVLVHGDFDVTQIFYSSGHFTGFIDFGEIRGNNRLFDLAIFAYNDMSPDRAAYYHLIDGYRESAQLTEDDLYAIELMALFILLRFSGKKVETKSRKHWYLRMKTQLERLK